MVNTLGMAIQEQRVSHFQGLISHRYRYVSHTNKDILRNFMRNLQNEYLSVVFIQTLLSRTDLNAVAVRYFTVVLKVREDSQIYRVRSILERGG